MEFKSISLALLTVSASLLILPTPSLTTQDAERLAQQRRAENQHQLSYNARPTQFMPASQVSQGVRARGPLIMPANNPIQTNSFYSSSQQFNQAHFEPINSASLATEPNAVGKTVTSAPRAFNSSLRPETGGGAKGFSMASSSPLELALRQASTDESVFQPSPIIAPPDSNLEWLSHAGSAYNSHLQQQLSPPTAATTEQSNNIAQNEPPAPMTPPIHYTSLDSQGYGHSLSQNEGGSLSSRASSGPNMSHPLNRSNEVVYEGPATAPPAGDYYFSSAEKLPNREKASNVWWALGAGQEFERASNLTSDDYLDYCSNSEFLVGNKQRTLCRSHPKIMVIVARGLKMAIDECQTRFTSSRWNCSLVLEHSLASDHPSSKAQVFGEVMKQPNRERSFLNAIFAAGLAHAMTKACSQNEIPEECSCDKKIRTKSNKGIEWVACSDDIDFGARFSRDFTDTNDNEADATAMINTHNYEVGRRVFKSATDITCTCSNGENGLCKTKRCWKHLGSFKDIGEELMKRYESATHVQLSSKDPHKLRPVKRGVRRPKRKDLVYIDESPDYCNAQVRIGVLGTQNRRCNSTTSGPDSCSLLCCGRGYQVVVEEIEEDCNCKFVWCCQVKCDRCKRHVTNDVCN